MEVFHQENYPQWKNPHFKSMMKKDMKVPFGHVTIYFHHKSSLCGVNSECLHVF